MLHILCNYLLQYGKLVINYMYAKLTKMLLAHVYQILDNYFSLVLEKLISGENNGNSSAPGIAF